MSPEGVRGREGGGGGGALGADIFTQFIFIFSR